MPEIINLPSFSDPRGRLVVLEKSLPFNIKRVYWICDVPESSIRGEHAHKKTRAGLVCIKGECEVFVNNGNEKETFTLDSPNKCLILNPEDWHIMKNFSKEAVLLVLSSEYYDAKDYIKEEPK